MSEKYLVCCSGACVIADTCGRVCPMYCSACCDGSMRFPGVVYLGEICLVPDKNGIVVLVEKEQ